MRRHMTGSNARLGRTVRSGLALSTARSVICLTEGPFVLASSVAFVVLSSATEVGVGEGLLRGHDYSSRTVAATRWAVLMLAARPNWLLGDVAELDGHLDVCEVVLCLRRVRRRRLASTRWATCLSNKEATRSRVDDKGRNDTRGVIAGWLSESRDECVVGAVSRTIRRWESKVSWNALFWESGALRR